MKTETVNAPPTCGVTGEVTVDAPPEHSLVVRDMPPRRYESLLLKISCSSGSTTPSGANSNNTFTISQHTHTHMKAWLTMKPMTWWPLSDPYQIPWHFQAVQAVPMDTIALLIYSVSQKKVAPLKLFAIFSFMVNLCNWKLSWLLPKHISMFTPILVHLSKYLYKLYHFY